jgi:hypothetical protein
MKEKFKLKNGNILYIIQDENPSNPRGDDNLGTMICFHNRYDLGDSEESKTYNDTEELFEYLANISVHDLQENGENLSRMQAWEIVMKRANENAIILPLALYNHSGLTMWIGNKPSSFDSGKWDSGQIGWIYVTRDKIKQEYSGDGGRTDEQIIEYLTNEVQTYDQYLKGDVYGFKIVKPVTKTWVCKETKEEKVETEEQDINSCWGFFGTKHDKNGLYDYADITKEDILVEEEIED